MLFRSKIVLPILHLGAPVWKNFRIFSQSRKLIWASFIRITNWKTFFHNVKLNLLRNVKTNWSLKAVDFCNRSHWHVPNDYDRMAHILWSHLPYDQYAASRSSQTAYHLLEISRSITIACHATVQLENCAFGNVANWVIKFIENVDKTNVILHNNVYTCKVSAQNDKTSRE